MYQVLIESLKDRNNELAYQALLKLEAISIESDVLSSDLEQYLTLILSDNSYWQIRGFRLLTLQAKWLNYNDYYPYFFKSLFIFESEKPIIIRQAISALTTVVLYQPQLHLIIKETINNLNLEFSDSMQKLIQRDIKNLEDSLIY